MARQRSDSLSEGAQAVFDRLNGAKENSKEIIQSLVNGITEQSDDEVTERLKKHSKAMNSLDSSPDEEEDAPDPEINTPDPDEEEGDEEESEDEPDEEEGDEEESDDETDDDDYEEVPYSDEDVLDVEVDGETVQASIRELKQAFSGEGAIAKRLKEATEAREAANTERAAVQNEIQEHRVNLLRTIQQLDEVLFQPLVNEPDSSLRTKNMNEYLLQKDAWEEDQKRITASREKLAQYMQSEAGKLVKATQEYRASEQTKLIDRLPELRDPQKAQKVKDDIMMAAKFYGFTDADINAASHHGLFLMARDAARWLNMQKFKEKNAPNTRDDLLKRKRRLKPGAAKLSTRKLEAKKSAKEQRVVTMKAQKSGRVDDIASMLASTARVRTQ